MGLLQCSIPSEATRQLDHHLDPVETAISTDESSSATVALSPEERARLATGVVLHQNHVGVPPVLWSITVVTVLASTQAVFGHTVSASTMSRYLAGDAFAYHTTHMTTVVTASTVRRRRPQLARLDE
jgi:hypothetical protein